MNIECLSIHLGFLSFLSTFCSFQCIILTLLLIKFIPKYFIYLLILEKEWKGDTETLV